MNKIWLSIVCLSLIYGLSCGNITSLNQVIINVGRETFDFALPLVMATCFWSGILKVSKRVGLLSGLQKLFSPILNFLFPDLRNDHESLEYIAANITINMFGLGFAATPSGLKAMESMQKHNPHKEVATRAMITFLVLNTAGVTLLSTTIITLRSQFGALIPTDYMPYAIVGTFLASVAGLTLDRWLNYRD